MSFIWDWCDRQNLIPCLEIKKARPSYTLGYNSGYARVYPARSDYTSLNDISKLQNQCELIITQHIIFHTNEGVRRSRGLSHIFQKKSFLII